MAQPPRMGFLAELGLNVDREAIAKAQKQQQMADALGLAESVGYKTAHEQTAGNIGALLGARLSKPDGLTPDQERRAKAAEAANKRMEEWVRANAASAPADREEKYMEFVADEAFRNGLPEVGTQASTALDERRKVRRLQEVELELAGLKVPAAKLDMDATRANIDQSRDTGRYKTIWRYGENNPNAGRRAYMDPATGDALAGPGGPVIAKAGEYTDKAPERPDAWGRGGRGAGFGATNTEMGKVRDAYAALYRRGNTLDEMRTVLEESIDTTGTLAATGNAGKLVAWTSRLGNDIYNMMSAAGMAGEFTALGADGKEYSLDTSSGRQKLAAQYKSTILQFLPEQFHKTGQQADKWASLVTELMYLEARSAEAGAKQFSDKDIEAMAAIIGANVNDPKALRDILLSSYNRAAADLEYSMLRYPPQVRNLIVDPEAQMRLDEQRAEVLARWEQPLGGTDAFTPDKPKGKETPEETAARLGIKLKGNPATPTPPGQQTNPVTTGSRGPLRRRN